MHEMLLAYYGPPACQGNFDMEVMSISHTELTSNKKRHFFVTHTDTFFHMFERI